jgi:type III pantothenate kinase
MKNAVIDIGNTNTKIAVFKGDDILNEITLKGFDPGLATSYLDAQADLENVIVSSVINLPGSFFPDLQAKYRLLAMSPEIKLPLTLLYKTPHTLGHDRIAAVVGARQVCSAKDVLSIDVGTCFKYDFITRSGEYLGGAISPGLGMRLKALSTFTGKLPLVSLKESEFLTGSSTEESILSGVINGALFEIRGTMEEYRKLYPGIVFVLTGGDHKFFEGKLKSSIFVVPDLVLRGLHEILKYNVRQR